MLKEIFKKAIQPIWKLFGVSRLLFYQEEIIRQLTADRHQATAERHQILKELKSQQHQLDKVASHAEFTDINYTRLTKSNKYKNARDLISLLTPMDVKGGKYCRLGQDFDGGYVMLDAFSTDEINAAYSFGISNDVSWDEDIAERGIEVYMYDHTIDKLPKKHPRFHFFKEGVTGDPEEEGLKTLSSLIVRNRHQESKNLILKMDIEGYEWGVFEETPSDVIAQFSQIVIEFHGLDPSRHKEDLSKILFVLNKINQTHQSIHIHANGYCTVSWLPGITLPHVLEVTYIRRSDYADRLIKNTRTFPTPIDQPTFPWLPDVPLGTFSSEIDAKKE